MSPLLYVTFLLGRHLSCNARLQRVPYLGEYGSGISAGGVGRRVIRSGI